jgi:hypothetical protein
MLNILQNYGTAIQNEHFSHILCDWEVFLEDWFSTFSLHQHHLKGLLKH